MRRLFLEDHDPKARLLARAASDAGMEPRPFASRVLSNVRFLRGEMRVRRGDAYLVRYLSGQPSRMRTLLALIDDVIRLAMFRMLGVRTLWLCHNVDRESPGRMAWVAALRRALWTRAATRILIPDPSLMPCASTVFRKQRPKLAPICFGPLPTSGGAMPRELERSIVEHFEPASPDGHAASGARSLRILVAGEGGGKYLHFDLLPQLHEALLREGYSPRIVVVSPLSDRTITKGRDYAELIRWCHAEDDVLLVDRWLPLQEEVLRDHVDVIWRAMGDYSMPFTLFNAARARIPVLTYDAGHLARNVEAWGIGATVRWDFGDIGEAVERALAVNEDGFERFLSERTWDRCAGYLREVVASL